MGGTRSSKRTFVDCVKHEEEQSEDIKRHRSYVEVKVEEVFEENGDNKENVRCKIESEDVPEKPANVFPHASVKGMERPGPKNWDLIYNTVVDMRAKFTAPVDTQGCERMPDTINANVSKRNPKVYRFQLLVSLMLSSQTKDEVNHQAMVQLHQAMRERGFEEGLCLEAVLQLSEYEIDKYICKVGFHRRKSEYIRKACLILKEKHNGDIPNTIEDITALPGVGPKMGYLLLQNGWGVNTGIGVDVHLHRLAQMWGWVPKSDKPEKTRAELEKWLPKELWADVNPLLVGFGQTVCVPKANNCDICALAVKGLCKSANKKLLKEPLSDARIEKLRKQRGNLTKLLEDYL